MQLDAAIAALPDDAASAGETDWLGRDLPAAASAYAEAARRATNFAERDHLVRQAARACRQAK